MLEELKNRNFLENINILLFSSIFWTLPFSFGLNSIAVGLYIFFILVFLPNKTNIKSEICIGFVLGAFFWLSVLWLRGFSVNNLEFILRLLPLGVLPIIMAIKKIDISIKQITVVISISSILAIMFGIYTAIEFYNRPDQHFSLIHLPHTLKGNYHSVFFAIQLGVNTILLSICFGTEKRKRFLFTAILFLGTIILLGKRMVLISLTVLAICHTLSNLNKKRILALIFSIVILTMFFVFSPYNKWRIEKINQLGEGSERIIMFESSLNVIKDNLFFGVGTYRVSEYLENEYLKLGLSTPFYANNPHNLILYTVISFGLIGIIIYFFSQIIIIRKMILIKHWGFIYMYAYFFLISLTETILIRQQGIVLYTFILSYFLFNSKPYEFKSKNIH